MNDGEPETTAIKVFQFNSNHCLCLRETTESTTKQMNYLRITLLNLVVIKTSDRAYSIQFKRFLFLFLDLETVLRALKMISIINGYVYTTNWHHFFFTPMNWSICIAKAYLPKKKQ